MIDDWEEDPELEDTVLQYMVKALTFYSFVGLVGVVGYVIFKIVKDL